MASYSQLIKYAAVLLFVLLAAVHSKPTSEAIVGSPYLFHEFHYPVDPHRGSKLSPAFQAANGKRGANLVAFFGTGGLRSVERPAVPVQQYHKK